MTFCHTQQENRNHGADFLPGSGMAEKNLIRHFKSLNAYLDCYRYISPYKDILLFSKSQYVVELFDPKLKR